MVIQGMNWLFCVQHVVCFILIVLIAHTLLVFLPDDDSDDAVNVSGDIGSANDSCLYHVTS